MDKHRVAELSEVFPCEHLAPDSNLVVDVGLEPVERAVRARHEFGLRGGGEKQDSRFKTRLHQSSKFNTAK